MAAVALLTAGFRGGSGQASGGKPYLPIGLFFGQIEEGARIFTPARLLPLSDPEALGHEFPTLQQLHGTEFEALLWLGGHAGLRLWATLQRYPREPSPAWPYPAFDPPPDTTRLGAAPIVHLPGRTAPLPGLRAVLYGDRSPILFLVDTRGLTLAARGMKSPTTMGLDVTRQAFLQALAQGSAAAPPVGLGAVIYDPRADLSTGQEPQAGYRMAASMLGHRDIADGQVAITRMDPGRMGLDTNRFTALVTNEGDAPRTLGLSLKTMPGLWVPANWQRGYRFEIPPRSQRRIEAPYVYRRMTPEASLRVAFGMPQDVEGGIEVRERFFDTTLTVGMDNPAASDPRPAFDTLSTEHFQIFAWRGSAAAKRLPAIAADRERALQRLAGILAVPFAGRIRLVLYPDSATKTTQTGHIGNGFASGRTIIEILNDSTALDPYHEVAHIVAGERGAPPALLEEGFAVYISESLGADALEYLGAPGKSITQVVCGYMRAGTLIPLERLFRFTDIGSDSTLPEIAYPEAASVTAFLIERYGIERFRDLYAQLRNTTNAGELRRNEEILEGAYGLGPAALEPAWRAWLPCRGVERIDGATNAAPQNAQFALNVIHWPAGILEPGSANRKP